MDQDDALTAALAIDLDGTFERLVVAHQDRLYSIALRVLGDAGAAEEAAQDAFVRAYRALGGYDPARIRDLALRPWLTTIVLNLCRTRATRRSRKPAPVSLDAAAEGWAEGWAEPRSDEATGPAAVADRHAGEAEWAELLDRLTATQRTVVVLRHVVGLSYPEMAAALGRPEGTVKTQVHRGVAALRSAYEAAGRRPDRRVPEEMTA